jgi:23S rRNA (guanine745-N1)-methyltransferase
VNLLRSQKSSKAHHGDDRLMIQARQAFLDKGYYDNLRDFLGKTVRKYASDGSRILDAGCGDGYYLSSISTLLNEAKINVEIGAVDISKDALKCTMKRAGGICGAVASVFELPLKNKSVDTVLNVFSPLAQEEYLRVLTDNGILIRVTPLENHLFSLKKAVYDKPLKNDAVKYELDGFEIIEETELNGSCELICNGDIQNLFMMTPYYYKTGESDQRKLREIESLTVETAFKITVYRKNG